jgi:hypothetical protein
VNWRCLRKSVNLAGSGFSGSSGADTIQTSEAGFFRKVFPTALRGPENRSKP